MLQFDEAKKLVDATDEDLKNINSPAGNRDHSALKKFHQDNLVKIKLRAEEDGKLNQPPENDEALGFEKETEASYTAQYQLLMQQESGIISKLNNQYNAMLNQFLSTPEGELRKNIYDSEKEYEYAKVSKLRPTGQTDGLKFFIKNTWFIYAIIILLGVLELPINSTVFKAFKLSKGSTILTALLLVILIPIASHFTGLFLKRWKTKSSNKVWSCILLFILIAFSFAMSIFRYVFFEAENQLGEFDSISQAFENVKIASAFSNPEFYVTLFFNVLLITVGIVLGFVAHDSDYEFEAIYKDFHYSRPNYQRELQKLQAVNNIQTRLDGRESTEQQFLYYLMKLAQQHNQFLDFVRNFAMTTNEYYIEAVNLYKETNQSVRTTAGPVCWSNGINPIIELMDEKNKLNLLTK